MLKSHLNVARNLPTYKEKYVFFGKKSQPLLGLDITTSSVKLIEISRSGKRYRVESYSAEPTPPSSVNEKAIVDAKAVGEAIRRAVKRSGAKATDVAIAISGDAAITKVIQMPSSLSERDLEGQVEIQADQYIPRDRVVDGLNQTSLLFNGDGYGRRDYLFAYEGAHLQATIKEQFKAHWPAPGSPGFALPVFDLYRDVKETQPLLAAGMWSVAYFSDMRERHEALKKRFPDRTETRGEPYGGIADLRPETLELLEYYRAARQAAQ